MVILRPAVFKQILELQEDLAMEHNTPDGRTIKPPDRERVVDARHTPEIHAASGHEKLLTASELEAWLEIDRKTVYTYVQRGLIPYIRIQSNVRFRRSEIWTGLRSTRIAPTGARKRSSRSCKRIGGGNTDTGIRRM